MRLSFLVILTLGGLTVWGFPERRAAEKAQVPQLTQLNQEKKEYKTREAPRDCKGKCATSIAQKAAAEAKAAQAAQNAAGAQAAHMVTVYFVIKPYWDQTIV
jgi:hypothetical protein